MTLAAQFQGVAQFGANVAFGVGVVAGAGAVAAAVGAGHRWYARRPVPEGLAVLAGVSVVALALSTTTALDVVIERDAAVDGEAALANVTLFALAAGVSLVCGRLGDRIALAVVEEDLTEVGRIVRSVGRNITVTLPEEVADAEGHDPLPPELKAQLAGKSLSFPRGLTVDELRSRLVTRLKADYGVGSVDVELTPEGDVEYLALGSRVAGLGPTLAPGSAGVAVRADPAFTASPGDAVQVWTDDPPSLVTTAELRATAGDVVTLAVDAADAATLDASTRYRLVTLPATARSDREFAALLRAADETLGVVTVGPDSPLRDLAVGDLAGSVVAIAGEAGVTAVPHRDRPLAAGETAYVVARPDVLRRLDAAANGQGTPPLRDRATADD